MKGVRYVLASLLVIGIVRTAHGGVVLDGGGLLLAEQGGTFDVGNLAPNGTPFSLDEYGVVHFIAQLNDLTYGNGNSWLGNGDTGSSGPFAGISLGATPTTIQSIAFGRDNGGEEQVFMDRWAGLYTLQYTQVANPSETTADADWTTIGTLEYQSAGGPGFDQPWLRHRYNIDSVEATGLRLMVPGTGGAGGTAIDEIELYAEPGQVHEYRPIVLTPAAGFSITWDENEGDFFDSAAPPLQAGAPDNVALAAGGGTAFGSSEYPSPAHEIFHANDGFYGNSNSWLADPGDANPFIGIDFAGTDPVGIENIAFGRDNGNSEEPWSSSGVPGQLEDRWPGVYTLQYTLLPDPDELTDDTGDPNTGWANVGTIDLQRIGGEGEPAQEPWLRHLFDVSADAKVSIMATGIRLLTPQGNVIDEIEVNTVRIANLLWDVPGHVDLTWEGSSNWTPGGGPPDNITRATIGSDNTDTITVNTTTAEAYSLSVENGGVAILDGQKLSVAAEVNFAEGTSLELGDGATLSARRGSIDTMTTGGDATVEVTFGTMTVHDVNNTNPGAFTKSGAGTLTLPPVGGNNPLQGHNPLILAGGTLEIDAGSPPMGLVLSDGGLELAEEGGTFDEGNLAEGATPFAFDELGPGLGLDYHLITNLNDLEYGNDKSWIGDGDTGTSGPIAGISLGGSPVTVQSIAFGRSNVTSGDVCGGGVCTDRWPGLYTLQYTQVANPSASTPDEDWTTIGTLDYQFAGGAGFEAPHRRHRYNFDAVEATGIRLIVPLSGLGGGTAVDEIELYATAIEGFTFEPLDMSAVDLRVAGDSTLSLVSRDPVSFASLSLESGILTNGGVDVSFTGGTTVDAEPDGVVGVNFAAGMDLGEINVVGATPVTFVKAGTGDFVLRAANRGTGFEHLTFDVQEGRLIGVHGSNPFGEAALQLSGGEVVLSSAGESALYDNKLTVTQSSTLSAGAAGGGVAEELTVTLGSIPDNGLNIDAGKTLTLQATDGYSLNIAAAVNGPEGNVRVEQGNVTFAAGGSLAGLRISAGTTVGTGAEKVLTIGSVLRLDTTTLSIDEGTLDVTGADLLAGGDVTVSGGVLTIANNVAPPPIAVPPEALALTGGIELVEEGGEFAPGNLAEGAIPFALDELDFGGRHLIVKLNDLIYGNDNSWIGNGDTGTSGPFVGISLGGSPMTVGSIAFGRSNVTEGDVCGGGVCTDRWPGLYTLQYTQVPNPDATTTDENWIDVGTLDYIAADGEDFAEPWRRHRYVFDAVEATGIRLIVPGTGLAGGTAIDEIELYGRTLAPVDMPLTNFVVTAGSTVVLDSSFPATLGNFTLDPGVSLQITGSEVTVGDLTAGHEAALSASIAVGGALKPDGRLKITGTLELGENATYQADFAEWDSENVADPWSPIPPTGPVNDRIDMTGGDALLGGTLELVALGKLSPPHPAPGNPQVMLQWYGHQTRTIMSAAGENSVSFQFDAVPEALPEVPNIGTNWGQGHLGEGVFLTRETNTIGDADPQDQLLDQPGISYFANATLVHLFQAADGDTNGDGTLDGLDLQAIQAAQTFGTGAPADWTTGDFTAGVNGDSAGVTDGEDLQAILATGLWGTPQPYAAVDPGDPGDGVVDLILDPGSGGLSLSTDGVVINGYVIKSAGGIFTGEPAQNLGAFQIDNDQEISGNFFFTLDGEHFFGNVIGSEWEMLTRGGGVNPFEDLTFTYTRVDMPGTFFGNLIVIPEPATRVLLAGVLIGLLLWRRRVA